MKSKIKYLLNINFILSNILFPLITLLLYCSTFAYLSSRLLLDGVNYHFAYKFEKYILYALAVASIFFTVAIVLRKRDGIIKPGISRNKFYWDDLFLLLLPLTPVVQYIIINHKILPPAEAWRVLIFFAFFSGIYIFTAPLVLGLITSNRAMLAAGLAFTFTVTNMAVVSQHYSWHQIGALRKQLVGFSIVFGAAWFLYNLNLKWILHVFIVMNFVANSSAHLMSNPVVFADDSASIEDNRLLSLLGEKRPSETPSIYFLVYDAYVVDETMLGYGIDNGKQEDYLISMGFNIYRHTYSTGAPTLPSLGKVFDVSSEDAGHPRKGVSGNGVTQSILHDIGYTTYGLFPFDYMFRGYGGYYDISYPDTSTPQEFLINAILLGEFRFDIGFEDLPRDLFIEIKNDIFNHTSGDKEFVFMYNNLPTHTQNSGACLPDEVDNFKARLKNANLEMRQDVELITKNNPDAIIIVAGDHGPYLTKNCTSTTNVYDISQITRLDIQDRYGSFLAIRWPTDDYVMYDDIQVLQDLFPSVFSYIYKDTSILKAKIIPKISAPNHISDVEVDNGIIIGGINDGESLFLSDE